MIRLLFPKPHPGAVARIVLAFMLLFCTAVSADHPEQNGQETEIPLPAAFAEQFPGYRGLDSLETIEGDAAVYLAQTTEGEPVLLCGTQHDGADWTIIESTPLPPQAKVVTADGFQVLDLGYVQCTVRRYHDDVWGIRYTGFFDLYVGPEWIGYYGKWADQDYGSHPWGNLTTIDWTTLTNEPKEAMKYLDISATATPDHPDRNGRTLLYEKPDTESAVTAQLYNGAPLFVTEKNGEWTRIRVGRTDGTQWMLEGWIRTDQLAFADGINRKHFTEEEVIKFTEFDEPVTLMTPAGNVMIEGYDDKDFRIMGEQTIDGRDCWLVYSYYTEQVGYVFKDDLYEGNG